MTYKTIISPVGLTFSLAALGGPKGDVESTGTMEFANASDLPPVGKTVNVECRVVDYTDPRMPKPTGETISLTAIITSNNESDLRHQRPPLIPVTPFAGFKVVGPVTSTWEI